MIQVIGVLMGVDLNAFERPEGSSDSFDPKNPEASAPPAAASSSSTPSAKVEEEEVKQEEAEPMEVDEEAGKKEEAEAIKKQGNEAYKARRFEEAIEFYEKAWSTWPKDISFLTNLAGEFLSFLFSFRGMEMTLAEDERERANRSLSFVSLRSRLLRAGRVRQGYREVQQGRRGGTRASS